jgi:hypothetical protein
MSTADVAAELPSSGTRHDYRTLNAFRAPLSLDAASRLARFATSAEASEEEVSGPRTYVDLGRRDRPAGLAARNVFPASHGLR